MVPWNKLTEPDYSKSPIDFSGGWPSVVQIWLGIHFVELPDLLTKFCEKLLLEVNEFGSIQSEERKWNVPRPSS